MASLHKSDRSRFWIAHYRVWDAAKGTWKRAARSTRCTDRDAAQRALDSFQAAANTAAGLAPGSFLSSDHVQGVVVSACATAGVHVSAGPTLPLLRDYIERYMAQKVRRVKPQTLNTYQTGRRRFEGWLPKGKLPLDWVTPARVQDYYAYLLNNMAPKSANDRLRWLAGVMNRAVKEGLLPRNPCDTLDTAPSTGVLERQPFTLAEAHQLLAYLIRGPQRNEDWARAALVSLQSGARLVDCLTLERSALRYEGEHLLLTFVAGKTGKTQCLPLVLAQWHEFLMAGAGRLLCPLLANEYTRLGNARLSHEFTGLVAAAGIEQSFRKAARGRQLARKTFHSLRHTLRSAIVAGGGSDAQADLVLGHSAGQGRTYTHSELTATAEVLQRALGDGSGNHG